MGFERLSFLFYEENEGRFVYNPCDGLWYKRSDDLRPVYRVLMEAQMRKVIFTWASSKNIFLNNRRVLNLMSQGEMLFQASDQMLQQNVLAFKNGVFLLEKRLFLEYGELGSRAI